MSRRSTALRPHACALLLLLLLLLLPPSWAARRASAVAPRAADVVAAARGSEEARDERLRVFDEVWETVRARYYDPHLRGLDWAALRERYRPEAGGAAGRGELYAVLRRLLAHLLDPHTRVHAPGESPDWRATRYPSVRLQLREVAGEVVVARVERGSAAERAGVRAGDALVSVGGAATEELLARRLSAATDGGQRGARLTAGARLRAVAGLLDGPEGSTVSAVFRDAGGREKSATLSRELVARTPALRVSKASGGAGVVEFNLFTPEIAAGVARALGRELRGARGVVIDLRENGGGEIEAMTDIASLFLPPGRGLGRFYDRAGRTHATYFTRPALLSTADTPPRFAGPVVVLVGPRTASAGEVFAAALRETGRAASVVGETTCGCVLGIRRRHPLPDGGTLDVSEMDYRTADGLRLEGAGVAPDETAAPTRRDLREGRDPAHARAVEIIKAAVKGDAAGGHGARAAAR